MSTCLFIVETLSIETMCVCVCVCLCVGVALLAQGVEEVGVAYVVYEILILEMVTGKLNRSIMLSVGFSLV